MAKEDQKRNNGRLWRLPTQDGVKDYWISGRLVYLRDKGSEPPSGAQLQTLPPEHYKRSRGPEHKLLGFPVVHDIRSLAPRQDLQQPPQILSLAELARQAIEGLDYNKVMNDLADMGPDARIALFFRDGKLLRYQIFEEPRICEDIQRGAVIHNLEMKPQDVSGWRTRDFSIDSKGCLGEVCARCLRVCPENAIHLRGDGASSFCEIDPTACKGCFICWVECSRKSADCILVDGKVFDSELRSAHFGE
jgi:Pyruvate/2-oxoacid:ferredoxin oxidoreductase delta subunit